MSREDLRMYEDHAEILGPGFRYMCFAGVATISDMGVASFCSSRNLEN